MATTINHAEIVNVDSDGNQQVIYPKTTGDDVSISPIEGSSTDTALGSETKSLNNLVNKLGDNAFNSNNVVNELTSTSTTDALSAYQGNVLNTSISGKAATSHASTATTYGIATTTNYGHVKLSTSVSSSSTVLAATPSAVKSAYDLANKYTSYTQTASYGGATWTFQTNGVVGTLSVSATSGLTVYNGDSIMTISSTYAPITAIRPWAFNQSADSVFGVQITSTGAITVSFTSGSSCGDFVYFATSWPCKGVV